MILFLTKNCSLHTVLEKELPAAYSSSKSTAHCTQFLAKNCSLDTVLEKRTVRMTQFSKKIRFIELRAVRGLL